MDAQQYLPSAIMASKQCLETYTNKLAHVREHRNQLNYVSLLIHADKLA